MFSLAEKLCTLSGHSFRPLCLWVVRRDAKWRTMPSASFVHRELRARFADGISGLPFPPPAQTVVSPEESDAPGADTSGENNDRRAAGRPFSRKTA